MMGLWGKREHIYEIIAENIRKERRRLGITQAELAERADVSLDTTRYVEKNAERRKKMFKRKIKRLLMISKTSKIVSKIISKME